MKKIRKFISKIKKRLQNLFRKRITVKKMFNIISLKLPSKLNQIKNDSISYVTMDITKGPYPKGTVYFQEIYYNQDSQKAYEKAKAFGAKLCFLTNKIEDSGHDKIPFVVVKNPHNYFVKICKYLNRNKKITTICVTGSIGKTSAKQFIYEVISSKYKTCQNKGNDNLRLHIGSKIQHLKKTDEFYVQEVGGCIPGMIDDSASMLTPDCFVVTNIGDSHIENYGSKEGIAKDKLSIDKYLRANGVAILNYDDEILCSTKLKHKVISYGINNKNVDYYAKRIKQKYDILEVEVATPNGDIVVDVNCIGKHNAYNVLIAFIVGQMYNMTNDEIKSSLENYHPSGVRQNLRKISDKLVYLDCFNSSYNSVKNALEAIKEIKLSSGSRKIVVLGDVLEMGDYALEVHSNIGKLVDLYAVDILITIGENSKYIYDNVKNKTIKKFYAKNNEELIKIINDNLKKGDLIMFKASHGMYLSYIADKIFGTRYYFKERYKFRKYVSDDDVQYTKISDEIELVRYPKKHLKTIKLDDEFDGFKIVGLRPKCFAKTIASKIVVGSNVRTIEKQSFLNCCNLKEVDLCNTKYICKEAFLNCPKLEKVYVGNLYCHVEENAFSNCNNVVLQLPKDSILIDYAKTNNINYDILE